MVLSSYTNPLTGSQQHFLRTAAERAHPNEACGFILNSGELIELDNRSTIPDQFVISSQDYARYDEEIAAVWHTHANYPRFSEADIRSCKALGLPFAMWDCSSSVSYWLDPRQSAGLVGRPWTYGVHDCYAAVRDWFWQEKNIALGDYPRKAEGEWHSAMFTHFEDNFRREGGIEVGLDELQRGDVLFFRIRNDSTCNHVAIVEDPGAGLLFHHMVNRMAELGLYSHWLRESTYMAVRHTQLC
jgi:proteasome lid subunit RPN8/RPN11